MRSVVATDSRRVTISLMTMAKEKTSAAVPYSSPRRTSGALFHVCRGESAAKGLLCELLSLPYWQRRFPLASLTCSHLFRPSSSRDPPRSLVPRPVHGRGGVRSDGHVERSLRQSHFLSHVGSILALRKTYQVCNFGLQLVCEPVPARGEEHSV